MVEIRSRTSNLETISKPDNIKKIHIDQLLTKYSVEDIESSLIELFLENKKIHNVQNRLIKSFIKNSLITTEIKNFLIKNDFEYDLKNMERVFELLIPEKDRKLNGAFYTPNFIVDYILDKTISDDYRICDPSCGSGAFLVSAAKKISLLTKKPIIEIIEHNIYGCDILDYGIRRTKIMLSLLALENGEDQKSIKFNLINGDSLTLDWKKALPDDFNEENWKKIFDVGLDTAGFDAIVGNPPYVRIQDLEDISIDQLIKKWKTVNEGNFNLYFAFFELGIKLLKNNGMLGFIVPNNFFTSFAAKSLRKWMQDNELLDEIIDFNHLQIFEDSTTYTCITILSKTQKKQFKYFRIEHYPKLADLHEIKPNKIQFTNLNPDKWRLMSEEDLKNVKIIETIGTPLGRLTNINTGIATLKDKLYFVYDDGSNVNYCIKPSHEREFHIPKEITRKIIKISDANNDEDVRKNKLRIIFPYRVTSKGYEIIPEKELQTKFPECYDYLLSIKNELSTRDKGKKSYPSWYAYGRGQGFEIGGPKLLTPTFSQKPKFMFDGVGESLFCNGYAISNSEFDLKILQKILNSQIMDYYINLTSVSLEGGFPCFQKNFIERFTIPEFTTNELNFLQKESNKEKLDKFLVKKYGLIL